MHEEGVWEGAPQKLQEYAGWYFHMYVRVRAYALFEKEVLHLRIAGCVPTCWVGGEEGGFTRTVRGGQPVGLPYSRGEIIFTL